MGPKRKSPNRSKSPKKGEVDSSFFTSQLNDDEWKALIALVVPSDALEELYIEQMEKTVKLGRRRRFTWLSKKEIIELINDNTGKGKGAPANKKPSNGQPNLPQQLIAVMESARPYLDNKEEIPDNIMSQIIKGKLVHIKLIEKEKEKIRLSRTDKKQSNAKPGTTAKKDKSPTGKKSPTKPKKANAGPLPEIEKQSQLKKKEDIEEEEKYLDDEPKDGPNHYIILSGFYSAGLLNFIDEFNISIDCLIKFKSIDKNLINKFIYEIEDREKSETNLKANLKITIDSEKTMPIDVNLLSEERRTHLNKVKIELEKFWLEAYNMLEKPQEKLAQHIARLKMTLKKDPEFKSWFDLDARTDFGVQIFDQIAEKLFSLVVQKRQYSFYINNLKLYSIPPVNPIIKYQSGSNETSDPDKAYDIRYYNELMDSIPAEYVSPAIILYSMVEQVAVNEEQNESKVETNSNQQNELKIPNLSSNVSKHFEHVLDNLALNEQEKQKLNDLLPNSQKPIDNNRPKKASSITPSLINFNDEIGSRLKGVFDDPSQKKNKKCEKLPFDPIQVETEMLSKSIFTVFTGLPNVTTKVAKERAARLQELLHFLTSSPDITKADVDRALKQFVFETMSLTDVNRKGYVKKNNQNITIPWDDPYPNISETLSEEQQLFLKSLNKIEAKKELIEKKMSNNRVSSASTVRSIKFQESESDNLTKDSTLSSILKSRPSTKLSVQSVHFPDSFDLNNPEQLNDIVPPRSVDQTVDLINSTKKRDLSDWIYAEHYDSKVLVQKLQQVSYTHPYVDSYYNRRDDSLMLVFSNPYDESSLSNHEEWTIKLHSNVGLRNYLEKIYDLIIEWTRDEEAKYQANLVAKEVDKFKNESSESFKKEISSPRPNSKGSKKRSPSPGKKKIKEKPSSPTISDESEYINDSFVGHNSLKAWKIEHDKLNESNQKIVASKQKPRSPKVNKSPVGLNSKKNSEKRPKSSSSKSPSKPSSRENSAKSRKTSRSNSKTKVPTEQPKPATTPTQKANESFIGYQVGNNMVYVKSHLSHMFPYNGCLIKTERHNLKTSSNLFVTTSVSKDENTFSLHVVDPNLDSNQNESNSASQNIEQKSNSNFDELESKNKIAKYTCFTGVFKDGISLSVSTQENISLKKNQLSFEPSPRQVPSPTQLLQQQSQQQLLDESTSSTKPHKKGAPSGKKGAKKGDATPEITKPKEEKKVEELIQPSTITNMVEHKEEPKHQILPWTQLHVSAPNGLSCTFLPETYAGVIPLKDKEPHRLVVKQKYTSKCSQKAGEHFKNFNPNILNEKSRLIKSDGTVIKCLNNNSTYVYYPNGTIYKKLSETSLESDLETVEPNNTNPKQNEKKDLSAHVEFKTNSRTYVTTPSGNEYLVNKEDNTNNKKLVRYYRTIQATDYQSGETMITREDNLKMVYRPDGSHLVEFEDGTRITTFYVDLQNGTTEFKSHNDNKNTKHEKYVKIECPGYATTIFNSNTTECTLAFGTTGTIVSCDPKRVFYNFVHSEGELIDVYADGSVSVYPKFGNQVTKNKFYFNQSSDIILEHEDELGNNFKVNKNGKNIIYAVNGYKPKSQIKTFNKHSPRFFIIHKDSSGTELLRQEDVNDYLNEVEVDPMTAIIRDCIQGYPNIMGTTVLRPLRDCLTDIWMSEYDEKDITPIGLRCRSLLTFPSNPEIKVPGSKFGTNLGRGINIDLNPNRKVKNPALQIAKRMEFRQLIEYQKLSDDMKQKLITGLKNYMIYIAERAEKHRMLLTTDPRNESEKLTASKILKLPRSDHLLNSDVTNIYKNAVNAKNSIDNLGKDLSKLNKLIIKPNSDMKKKKLEKELDLEKLNKLAWKKTFVPSYFKSEWGKAFLESLNKENINLERSENDFNSMSVSNNNNINNNSKKTKLNDKMNNEQVRDSDDSKQSNKKVLPPISNYETDYLSDKNQNLDTLNYNYERYQPQFKYINKLNSNKLPNSIKTTRPNAAPNTIFLSNEEPVRRKVKTSSVQAAQLNGKSLEKRRGCEVYPKEIRFGVLREGFTYVTEFEMINVGVDACRFKLKQPSPETGIKIMFKPGPIAAGMTRDFSVMLYAIYKISDDSDSEQVSPNMRKIKHDLEITTETDIIKIPIEAEIASIEEFRKIYRGNLEAGKEKNIRLLSVRPGSTREVLTKPLNVQNQNLNIKNETDLQMNESNEI